MKADLGPETRQEVLRIEEADAWFEYREALQGLRTTDKAYEEQEPWVAARLNQRLVALGVPPERQVFA